MVALWWCISIGLLTYSMSYQKWPRFWCNSLLCGYLPGTLILVMPSPIGVWVTPLVLLQVRCQINLIIIRNLTIIKQNKARTIFYVFIANELFNKQLSNQRFETLWNPYSITNECNVTTYVVYFWRCYYTTTTMTLDFPLWWLFDVCHKIHVHVSRIILPWPIFFHAFRKLFILSLS